MENCNINASSSGFVTGEWRPVLHSNEEVLWEATILSFREIYKFDLFLHRTTDIYFSEQEIKELSDEEFEPADINSPCGYVMRDKEGYVHILLNPDTKDYIMSHEIVHVISHVAPMLGLHWDPENDESIAYLYSGIYQAVSEAWFDLESSLFYGDEEEDEPTMEKMWEEQGDDVILVDGSYDGKVVDISEVPESEHVDTLKPKNGNEAARMFRMEEPEELIDCVFEDCEWRGRVDHYPGHVDLCHPPKFTLPSQDFEPDPLLTQYPLTPQECFEIDLNNNKVEELLVRFGNYLLSEERLAGMESPDLLGKTVTDADLRNFHERFLEEVV